MPGLTLPSLTLLGFAALGGGDGDPGVVEEGGEGGVFVVGAAMGRVGCEDVVPGGLEGEVDVGEVEEAVGVEVGGGGVRGEGEGEAGGDEAVEGCVDGPGATLGCGLRLLAGGGPTSSRR